MEDLTKNKKVCETACQMRPAALLHACRITGGEPSKKVCT